MVAFTPLVNLLFVCVKVFFPSGRPAAVMAECVCLLSSSLSGGTTPALQRSKWSLTKAQVPILCPVSCDPVLT